MACASYLIRWAKKTSGHRFIIPDVDYVSAPHRQKCLSSLRCGLGPPKVLEARRRQFSVANRMLDVLVPEVSLQGSRVVPSVSQCVATGMPEHVRVDLEPKPHLGT